MVLWRQIVLSCLDLVAVTFFLSRTLLEELAKIKSGDVVLPTGTKEGRYNGTVRLRCVTEPDEAQKVLLHRLGITLPRRLRRIDEFVQM